MLPFTPEVYFRLIAQYNAEIWPGQIVVYALGALTVLLVVLWPRAWVGRFVAAFLAFCWLWIGAVWHLQHYATIVWAAWGFAALFCVQGVLFARAGASRRKPVQFGFRAGPAGWAGLILMLFGLAGYPLVAVLAGPHWPGIPLFGVAPGPTTIFTLGLLLLAEQGPPRQLIVLPVLWSLVQGATALLMAFPADLVVPAAGILTAILAIRERRRATDT